MKIILESEEILNIELNINYDEMKEVMQIDDFELYIYNKLKEKQADFNKVNFIDKESYFKLSEKNISLFIDLMSKEETIKKLEKDIFENNKGLECEIDYIDKEIENIYYTDNYLNKINIIVYLKKPLLNFMIDRLFIKNKILEKLNLGYCFKNRLSMNKELSVEYKLLLKNKKILEIESLITINKVLSIEDLNKFIDSEKSIYKIKLDGKSTIINATNFFNLEELKNG